MPYILFMMFLITAPGQTIPKDKRLYTLQSTHSMEFDSPQACAVARDSIAESVAITGTILLVSSCLPKGDVQAAVKGEADKQTTRKPDAQFTDKKFVLPDGADKNGIIQFRTLPR